MSKLFLLNYHDLSCINETLLADKMWANFSFVAENVRLYVSHYKEIQCCPFIMLYFGSLGRDFVISELIIKGQFYKEMTGK